MRKNVETKGRRRANSVHRHREIRNITTPESGAVASRDLFLSYDRRLLERTDRLKRTIEEIKRRMKSNNRPVSMDNYFNYYQDG
ncbi:MAG: hypothetical protein GY721_03125 [Deltaproteobacteria bacterium]|nr:hypothetical protein [Deltaproteobacteria bacterium]